ncbi:uncharacterized protein LOC134269271 [Saccostrea cucullata]|uniref:uncharacterized protein LOC134269271 n=1 Tax=Saccostrea cuccullata TaxID=36930 RepID=UPI002ED64D5F
MASSKKETPVNEQENDTCHCPICLEKVRKPKYLSCYHTFCEACIGTYISSTATHKENETLKSIECPVCRTCIKAPRNDISDEEWASELPQNKLVLSVSVDPEQDENKYCMFCKRLEKSVSAKYWCKACMEAICEDCRSLHRAVPILQSHKILDISSIKEMNNDVEIEESCNLHEGKILDVFCHDHQELCCSVCHVKQHKLCKHVDTVEDIAFETDRNAMKNIALKYADLEKVLEYMLSENLNKTEKLNTRKHEICMNTEEKVEEIKSLMENAHAKWLKRFEQNHADSIGNIEIASDELKRFSTTVHEVRMILNSVLKCGSSKQLVITNHKLKKQISDHINRLRSLDVWNFSEDYKQHNLDFFGQISKTNEFEDVKLTKQQSWIVERIMCSTPEKIDEDNIIQRRKTMARKDWMNVGFRKLSQINDLPERVFYGLFIHDTRILLSLTSPPSLKIYDISNSTGKCIHTEVCQDKPYGLCRSGLCLNELFVSFENFICHYRIEFNGENAIFLKLGIIQLKEPMIAISRGPTTAFAANRSKTMICSLKFCINHTSTYYPNEAVPFVSSSLISDCHCFIMDDMLKVVDKNNKVIFEGPRDSNLRGLTFDLQGNILVCDMTSKLRQFKHGEGESRDISLADITQSSNVIMHPTGEKIIVLDNCQKGVVYQVY